MAQDLLVHAGKGVIGLHPQLHPGDVLDLDLGTVIGGPHHDLAELLLILQAVGQAHRIGELGARRGRFGTELAARNDHALGPDGLHDFRNRNAQMGQAVGFDPDAHGVVAGTQARSPGRYP